MSKSVATRAGRGMQRHESRFRGVKVKSCGRLRLPHRSNSQISLLQPAFLFCLQRRTFFRYFYFTDTRVCFSSLNFPIFILFSAFLVLRSFRKTHKESIYNKKVAFSSFCSCLEFLFLLRRGKIFRNVFYRVATSPRASLNWTLGFFGSKKKYKNFWSSPNCFVLYNSFACMTRWLFFFGAVCTPCLSYCCSASNRKKSTRNFFSSRKGRHEKKIRERKCKKSWIVRVC